MRATELWPAKQILQAHYLIQDFCKPVSDVVYVPTQLVAEQIDRTEDQAAFIITMFASFFLCFPLNFIEDPFWRKFYSSVSGFVVSLYFHGNGMFINLFFILSNYFLMKYLPRRAACYSMAVWSLTFLIVTQWFYFMEKYSGFLVTTILRMNFGKMTMIICNYSDAGQLQKHPLTSREKYYAIPFHKPLDFS